MAELIKYFMEEKHMTGGIEFLVVIAFIILVLLMQTRGRGLPK